VRPCAARPHVRGPVPRAKGRSAQRSAVGEPALNEEGAARRVPLDALADTRRTRPRLSADMPEGTMVTRAVAAAGGAARSKTAALVRRGLELGERVARRRAVECPVCGWEGLRFRPMAGARLRFDAECPR